MRLALRSEPVEVEDPRAGEGVRFRGVAVTPGTYTTEAGLDVEITADDLGTIAAKLNEGTQIRDLHEERIDATVGAVESSWTQGRAVRFDGRVAMEPHATVVRRFPDTIRFSVGFRLSRDEIEAELGLTVEEAVQQGLAAPLPADFGIDHLAIVGRGQDPDARLERLLNRAREHEPASTDPDKTREEETTMEQDELIAELKRQRDEALEARDQAQEELSRLEGRHQELKADLEDAETERQQALELLNQAKGHFADECLKLELKAGEDVDLTERRTELLDMGIDELDQLRLELADEVLDEDGPTSRADETGDETSPEGTVELELDELDPEDTIKLGLAKGAI